MNNAPLVRYTAVNTTDGILLLLLYIFFDCVRAFRVEQLRFPLQTRTRDLHYLSRYTSFNVG